MVVNADNKTVTTSDCTVNTVSACDALPRPNGIDTSTAYAIQILGSILIGAAYLVISYSVAEPRDNTREQRVRARRQYANEQALAVAGIYAFLHGVWGGSVGGTWNTLYWLVLAINTNDYSDYGIYTWPSLIGFIIVLICILIANWFNRQTRGGDADQKELTKEI